MKGASYRNGWGNGAGHIDLHRATTILYQKKGNCVQLLSIPFHNPQLPEVGCQLGDKAVVGGFVVVVGQEGDCKHDDH